MYIFPISKVFPFNWFCWLFQGETMTSIEPTSGRINDLCVSKGSGLIMLALDSSQIPSYFIPALGPAPKWCAYLENLTVWLLSEFDLIREVGHICCFWSGLTKVIMLFQFYPCHHRRNWRRVQRVLYMMISNFWPRKTLWSWTWQTWWEQIF